MANIKSQIKRIKKSEEQRVRNKAVRSALKTLIKKFESARQSGDAEAAEAAFRDASKSLDKAVSKGVIHKNKAANRKSRMSRYLRASR